MKSELVPANGDPPIPIVRDVTVIGRREDCDVTIDHSALSKRHCVIVRTDGLLVVRDLATTNGTKVNGQKVLWAALLPNDRLTLGGYKMRVYLGPDTAPAPSEQVHSQLFPAPSQAGAVTQPLPAAVDGGAPRPAAAFSSPSFSSPMPVAEVDDDDILEIDPRGLFDDDTGDDEDEIIELG